MVEGFVPEPEHLNSLFSCTSYGISAFQFCMWKMVMKIILTQPSISVINPDLLKCTQIILCCASEDKFG